MIGRDLLWENDLSERHNQDGIMTYRLEITFDISDIPTT
jgi:hypothetical protein